MLIINNAKKEEKTKIRVYKKGIYYERHHILPRSLFPLWIKNKNNIVLLTPREHYFCHQLLTKIYKEPSMKLALWQMSMKINDRNKYDFKISSNEYERNKKLVHSIKILSFEDFCKKANTVHNNKYDYSRAEKNWNGSHSKIEIICPEHGVFEQIAKDHLKGCGCRECVGLKPYNNNTIVEALKEKLNDKNFDYNYVEYKNSTTKIKILCNDCGNFFERAPARLLHDRHNCPFCSKKRKHK